MHSKEGIIQATYDMEIIQKQTSKQSSISQKPDVVVRNNELMHL